MSLEEIVKGFDEYSEEMNKEIEKLNLKIRELYSENQNLRSQLPKKEGKFTIEEIRRIVNDAPESWNNSLSPYEKQAIDLITQLYPQRLGEGVYNVLANLLDDSLKRGQFSMEEYEKEKELKKVRK